MFATFGDPFLSPIIQIRRESLQLHYKMESQATPSSVRVFPFHISHFAVSYFAISRFLRVGLGLGVRG